MIEHAKNPKWADSGKSQILLDVKITGQDEYCPFVASCNDCTTHGPMLFNFAVNGLFGPVQDSDEERIIRGEISPPEGFILHNGKIICLAQAEIESQAKFDFLLSELQIPESVARAEIDEDYAAERKAKITALLAVKKQKGWPLKVKWPE